MTNREFLNNLSDEDFADAILADTICCIACVENTQGENSSCPFEDKNCIKCIVKYLQEEAEICDVE